MSESMAEIMKKIREDLKSKETNNVMTSWDELSSTRPRQLDCKTKLIYNAKFKVKIWLRCTWLNGC
jgi:hypothetical protein